MKLPLWDLNPGPCPPHLTSTNTYGMTTMPRVHGNFLLFKGESKADLHFVEIKCHEDALR